jgi:fatty acid synthase subunit beta, fungi type
LTLIGFSIIDIVRNDPKTLTIYFGGHRGRQLRKNYLDMTIQKQDKDGNVITEPLLKSIGPNSTSYTFSDPRGLLYSTQFAQPALTLMEVASFEDAKSRGLIQNDASFAGHSLGEYSALGAIGQVLSLESLMSLIFYRGLAMQVAMERDEDGKTEFSMVAVNPSRVGKGMEV